MVSYADLKSFERGLLDDIADAWQDHARNLRDQAGKVADQIGALGGWEGKGADAARSGLTTLKNLLEDSADQVDKIPPKVTDAADTIDSARSEMLRAVQGKGEDLAVSDSGEVTKSWKAGAETEDTKRDREARQEELQTAIDDALRKATEADESAAGDLRGIVPAEAGIDVGGADGCNPAPIPAPGTSPEKVAKWWEGLSPLEKETYLFSDSARLGNLDGLPIEVRDRANRFVLDEHDSILRTQVEHGSAADAEVARGKLEGIDKIRSFLGRDDFDGGAKPYLIGLDAEKLDKTGKAIVSIGNPDTADNVVTTVPGTYSGLASAGTDIGKSEAVHGAAFDADSLSETAAITWLGYDAPQNLPAAIPAWDATAGAEKLADFQEGLRVTHEGPDSHNVVMGHSYGGALVGHALQGDKLLSDPGPMDKDAVDGAVFVGAPGTGAVQSVDELKLDAEDVYATRSPGDYTGLAPGNGGDPTAPWYGAETFDSDVVAWTNVEEAHTSYWNEDENPTALKNMGRITVGEEPTVQRD